MCSRDTNNCDVNAACTNTEGSFTCTCNPYWTGNGISCADLDECATDNGGCGDASYFTCANNVGAPATCADVDECALDTDNCHANATCSNTVGGFTCACNSGYSGDGVSCTTNLNCPVGTVVHQGMCTSMCDPAVLPYIPTTSADTVASCRLTSTSAADNVTDCDNNEMRYDGGGSGDTVHGGNLDDIICGASGNDFLFGDAGHDWLFGQTDTDQIHGGDGDDWLFGGNSSSSQLIWGDAGDDIIFTEGAGKTAGGPGADVIAINPTGLSQSATVLVFGFELGVDHLGVAGALTCGGWAQVFSGSSGCRSVSGCGSPMSNSNVTAGVGCPLRYTLNGSQYYNVTLCGSYTDAQVQALLANGGSGLCTELDL